MRCTDNIISYRACGRTAKIYLDDYGLSLKSASNVVDDKFTNAKDMLDKLIQQSWDETFADITFDGMDASKILNDVTSTYMDKSGYFTGTKEVTYTLLEGCELGSFFGSSLDMYVKTGGETTINVIQGTTTSELYSGTTTDESVIELSLNEFLSDEFTIQVITDGEIYTGTSDYGCSCGGTAWYTVDDSSIHPFVFKFQVRCNKSKHLCKYVLDIAPVVVNKILGKFYFKVSTTDVFSNYVNSTVDKAIVNMIYYDDMYFGLSNGDPATKMKGQYQIKLEKLKLPKPTCKCCMQCNTKGWTIIKQKP